MTTAIDKTRNVSAMQEYPDATFMRDDKKLYFGNDGDASIHYNTTTELLTFNNAAIFSDAVTFNSDVTFANTAAFNSTTTFSDTATFNGTVTFKSDAAFSKPVTFSDAATFNSTSTFNSDVAFASTTSFSDTATFNENVIINGATDEVQLKVKGVLSQTAHLQTWTNSSDTVLAQIQGNGRISTKAGLYSNALEGGGSLLLFPHAGVQINHDFTAHTANYDYTGGTYESWLYDAAGEFEATDVGKWIIVRTGSYIGAMAEITNWIDADNVTLHTMGWDWDITAFGYYIIDSPNVVIGDSKHNEFNIGTNGHVDIHTDTWVGNDYSSYAFEVEMDAGANGVDGSLFEADANGYNDVRCIVADYHSGNISSDYTGGGVKSRIITTDAVSATSTTEIDAYLAVVINGSSACTTAYKAQPGFSNALEVQGATAINPAFGYDVDNSTSTVTDRVTGAPQAGTAFLSTSSSNIPLFDAVNDYILIGSAATFEIIEVTLSTGSSKNIVPTFEYSTGDGTWATLPVLGDGTLGFQRSGQISFNAPGAWAVSETAESASDISSAYYIRITRTKVPVIATLPIESHFHLYVSRQTGMLIRGNGSIKPVHMADASALSDSLYYSTTGSKLTYKDPTGGVHALY